jgi:dihydropteroate synthase
MGILNVTPDSFQREGRHTVVEAAVAHALRLVEEGADIVDVGGESTRPGAEMVPVEEEIRRVVPVIEALAKETDAPISADTRKPAVALAALAAGARVVNDVSAGRFGEEMFAVAAEAGAFLCLMHAPLDPATMGWSTGRNPAYADVVSEVRDFLLERTAVAESAGVARDRLWIDPGFGFGKSVEDNLALLRGLAEFAATGYPVLIGASRKSTLGWVLDDAPPGRRVNAGLAAAVLAIQRGASVIRAHDVAVTVEAARMADAILFSGPSGV